jgi:hypothetical protein
MAHRQRKGRTLPSRETDNWLKDAGYEHYCFISYPHGKRCDVVQLAHSLAEGIRRELRNYTDDAEKLVFIDVDVPGGTDWEERLRLALCRSVTMIAVCAPIYYEHAWCGREFNGMLSLHQTRLSGASITPIIPMIVRKSADPLPEAIQRIQYLDLVEHTTRGAFRRRQEFKDTVFRVL